jgi:hypothetical protein
MMGQFLERTWFLWWLFAIVIVGRWAWNLFANYGIRAYELSARWRNLYQQALVEPDEGKRGIRIQKAEGAILGELATQVFKRNSKERTALEEAMNNLDRLRQTRSEKSVQSQVSA